LNARHQRIAFRRNQQQPFRAGGVLAMDREMTVANNRTARLQQQVQRLQGTVRVLSGALQRQQRPRFNVNNRFVSTLSVISV